MSDAQETCIEPASLSKSKRAENAPHLRKRAEKAAHSGGKQAARALACRHGAARGRVATARRAQEAKEVRLEALKRAFQKHKDWCDEGKHQLHGLKWNPSTRKPSYYSVRDKWEETKSKEEAMVKSLTYVRDAREKTVILCGRRARGAGGSRVTHGTHP